MRGRGRPCDQKHELPSVKPRPPRPVAPSLPSNRLIFSPSGECFGFAAATAAVVVPPTPPASIVEAEPNE
jgi:hypothetical protein